MKVRAQRSDARTMSSIVDLPPIGDRRDPSATAISGGDPEWPMRDDSTPSAFSRFRAGESVAFADVVATYAGPAYSLAVAVLGDRGLAEKAVEEGMVRVAANAAAFDPARSIEGPWILQFVRDAALASLRTQSRYRGTREPSSPATAALFDDVLWRSVMEHATPLMVRGALESLTEAQRETLTLAYWKGLRPEEIANLRGVPEDLVRENLRVALQKVRDNLSRAVPGVFSS